jgi:hypothetical protein
MLRFILTYMLEMMSWRSGDERAVFWRGWIELGGQVELGKSHVGGGPTPDEAPHLFLTLVSGGIWNERLGPYNFGRAGVSKVEAQKM